MRIYRKLPFQKVPRTNFKRQFSQSHGQGVEKEWLTESEFLEKYDELTQTHRKTLESLEAGSLSETEHLKMIFSREQEIPIIWQADKQTLSKLRKTNVFELLRIFGVCVLFPMFLKYYYERKTVTDDESQNEAFAAQKSQELLQEMINLKSEIEMDLTQSDNLEQNDFIPEDMSPEATRSRRDTQEFIQHLGMYFHESERKYHQISTDEPADENNNFISILVIGFLFSVFLYRRAKLYLNRGVSKIGFHPESKQIVYNRLTVKQLILCDVNSHGKMVSSEKLSKKDVATLRDNVVFLRQMNGLNGRKPSELKKKVSAEEGSPWEQYLDCIEPLVLLNKYRLYWEDSDSE